MDKKVAVVGGGTMGNGIAQVFAGKGAEVTLVDVEQRFLDRAMQTIEGSLARLVKKEKMSEPDAKAIIARIHPSTSLESTASCELVIEAVPEKLELKKEIFAKLDAVTDSACILASNTSSISITLIGAVTERSDKVVGMHFMNPVPIMKLVEIIRGDDTSDETTAATVGIAKELGKVPVTAEDYPGFVANRILMPMINEAAFCLMEGVATREAIDEIMKLGMNHPMGPLTLADFIGLDVCLEILDVLHRGLGDDKYRACPLLRRKVAAGHFGRKTGRGFYRVLIRIETMVDFELPEHLQRLQDKAREFAETELIPNAARWDAEVRFPREAVAKAAELGFLGMAIPEEYGGTGVGNLAMCVVLEELNRGCASTGVTVSVHNSLFCSPVVKFGTEEQKQRILPKMATGEWIGAYCLSEAGAGSDAAGLRCSAKRDGDEWVLEGPKLWITTGSEADVYVVFARTGEHRTRGISAFIVERSRPGCEVGKKEVKLGIRASPTTEILLNECRVPAANLLGEEGIGFKIALDTLDGGRLGIASQSLGIGRACLEASISYAKEHELLGKSMAKSQAIQWTIADIATEMDAARLLTWRAASRRDQKQSCTKESAMAKSFASRCCNNAAREAVQIHGDAGHTRAFAVERLLRDARITEIYEGATDIQRLVIARSVMA